MQLLLVRTVALVRVALAALFGAAALVLAAGCERQIAPPLIEVTELAPVQLEAGERVEVHGVGFPQGRTGRVTLAGSAARPGEPPARVSVEAEGVVAAPDRLELVVREPLVERLCGRGDRAAHATFRGDARVTFESSTPGAPPLVGTLRGVTLDVTPSSPRADRLDARAAEGGRVLAHLGVVPGPVSARGLPVEQVREGSLAAKAGLQVGDVIASADGVNVLALADVAPISAREIALGVRRGGEGPEELKGLSLAGYSGERVPREFAPALVIVGLALAIFLLWVVPGPPALAALEARIAARLRRTPARVAALALLGSSRHAALSAIGSAVIAALAMTPYLVGREMDGALLFAAGAGALVWSRLVPERGVLATLSTLSQTVLVLASGAAALGIAVVQIGAIELAELARLQGGAPWQFSAARSPSCAVGAVVYGAAVVAVLRTRAGGDARDAPSAHAALLERAGLLLLAALFAAAFLGGWQLPWGEARGRALTLLAAGVFVLKTWAVTAVLLGLREVTSRLRARDLPWLFLKRLLPGLVLAALLVAASRRLLPSSAVESAFGATLVAMAALFVVRLAARVRSALSHPEPHASPFL